MTGPRLSIIPSKAVYDDNLSKTALRVLMCLGNHTDRDGWCFPSQGKMAAKLGLERSTVNRAIRELVRSGYVEKRSTRRNDGGLGVNHYRVIMDFDDCDDTKEHIPSDVEGHRGSDVEGHIPSDPEGHTINVPNLTTQSNELKSDEDRTPPPKFETFWGEWKSAGLANRNESKRNAESNFKRLNAKEKRDATRLCVLWQRLFRAENDQKTTMLHCERFLRDRRWEGLKDEDPDRPQNLLKITPQSPSWAAWLDYQVSASSNPMARDFIEKQGFMAVPSEFPPLPP